MEHTPGPWKAHRLPKNGHAEWEIRWSDDGECVAEVVYTEADAKLMAAGPEMLDALKITMSYLESFRDQWQEGEEIVYHHASYALAKAEGK